jgi:hypothetical protein
LDRFNFSPSAIYSSFCLALDSVPEKLKVIGHGCMVRGGHGHGLTLPMAYSSTPCEQATPETALWPFHRWPAHRASGLRPATPSDTPRHKPLLLAVSCAYFIGCACVRGGRMAAFNLVTYIEAPPRPIHSTPFGRRQPNSQECTCKHDCKSKR